MLMWKAKVENVHRITGETVCKISICKVVRS